MYLSSSGSACTPCSFSLQFICGGDNAGVERAAAQIYGRRTGPRRARRAHSDRHVENATARFREEAGQKVSFCPEVAPAMKAILVAALLIAPLAAQAQQYVRTTPASTTTPDASGTISATNTFQKVLSSNLTRSGCTIQNNGSHNMFVTENRGLSGSSRSEEHTSELQS